MVGFSRELWRSQPSNHQEHLATANVATDPTVNCENIDNPLLNWPGLMDALTSPHGQWLEASMKYVLSWQACQSREREKPLGKNSLAGLSWDWAGAIPIFLYSVGKRQST